MRFGKGMKIGLGLGFAALLMFMALSVNPQEIYYSYNADEHLMNVAESVVNRAEEKNEAFEIKYLGGNVYAVQTESYEYLIKKMEDHDDNVA